MDDGNEVLQVLKEIRDEAKATNTRLESLESRAEFLERRVSAGFEKLTGEITAVGQRLNNSEMRLATEVLSLASVTRDVRDLLARADLGKLTDRVRVLEEQISGRGK